MRNKNTMIMSISILIVALFIGTAMIPASVGAESVQQLDEEQTIAQALPQDPTGNEILCDEAVVIVVNSFIAAIRTAIESIDKEDIYNMIFHAVQYLLEFAQKVKGAFFTGLAIAEVALEALIGVAIDIAELAQMIWDVIDDFVLNVAIPLALTALETVYNLIIDEYGSIFNFLIEMSRPIFKLGAFLVWLAGSLAPLLVPHALWLLKNVVIPGLALGAQTLKELICTWLTGLCEPQGGGATQQTTGYEEMEATVTTGVTVVGATDPSSSSCSLCGVSTSDSTASAGLGI